ncbi:putative GrpE nucleotide exchange factor [Medicago truncatula]|uniref:GrpE protein homolog n=1 Tax=Medicago truncatula TaxID=3880 RepID=A0A072UXX1_MEDTR|nr:grpE protein homolog 2, mitochondrial [Medicago truncatula]KEH33928.1 co-chaperone GrpE family protein [Medicago truncatula]RHN67189.1 putative GrpE nucleotide exchange factor [Medicago truncatula]
MSVYRVLSRASRTFTLLSASHKPQPLSTNFFHQFSTFPHQLPNKLIPIQANLLYSPISSSLTPRFGFSSSASPESSSDDPAKTSEKAKVVDQNEEDKREGQSSESDSDVEIECDLSRDELIKLVTEKEALLKLKHKEVEKMQDKVLRTYAEMENVMDRTNRNAESSKKFAIQSFAKSLLDVADNLGRASSVVKDSFSKIESPKESDQAAPLLKTLLEGVEMTEKQLAEVLKKHGVEKYDPTNEPFDPNRHNAIFQIPDASKPPGTVGVVLKAGYMLYDRVLRPAEVGVTHEVEEDNKTDE